jgi:hypothetical protein
MLMKTSNPKKKTMLVNNKQINKQQKQQQQKQEQQKCSSWY